MTAATTQSPAFTFTRVVDAWGGLYDVHHAGVDITRVYRRGPGARWRATGTRGAYRTRHAAACAALAQRSAPVPALDAHDEQWATDVTAHHTAIADPQ